MFLNTALSITTLAASALASSLCLEGCCNMKLVLGSSTATLTSVQNPDDKVSFSLSPPEITCCACTTNGPSCTAEASAPTVQPTEVPTPLPTGDQVSPGPALDAAGCCKGCWPDVLLINGTQAMTLDPTWTVCPGAAPGSRKPHATSVPASIKLPTGCCAGCWPFRLIRGTQTVDLAEPNYTVCPPSRVVANADIAEAGVGDGAEMKEQIRLVKDEL